MAGQMQGWGSGYVTDVPYMDGFYSAQSPHHLALAATINGFEPAELDGGFSYCELGCGRGLTSLILAAVNPESEFHAVDFQPAHIAHANAQARGARLDNVTFHERSFEDLLAADGPVLPMFDVVTMHGVWTWIAPRLQGAIVEFLNRRLKPGGVVHVSYNALPAWMPMGPLQRALKELTGLWPGRIDHAIDNALAMLSRLAEAKVIPANLHDGLKRITDTPEGKLRPYLAHEYLNEYWQPVYHPDVARTLAGAKLSFASSTDLLKNFLNLCLTEPQRALISEIPRPELREMLKDYCVNDWLRQDVFVRGVRRMSEGRRDSLLQGLKLTLLRPPPGLIEIYRPDGSVWRPSPDAYAIFVKALLTRPHSVAELLALPGLPPEHGVKPVELVGVLVGTGLAAPFMETRDDAQSACDRLNRLTEAGSRIGAPRGTTIAVPSVAGGVTLMGGDFDLYMSARRGETLDPEALAARFVERCKEQGGHAIVDGKAYEDETEARAAGAKDYAVKIDRLVPIWRMIGMV